MSARTRLFVFAVTAPVIAFALVGALLGQVWARETPYANLRVFEEAVSLIANNYVEEVNLSKVMRGAMGGLAEGLDPDSAYLPPEAVREVDAGNGVGPADIGVALTRQYYLRVIAARDGSPAARAGLRAGDFLRVIGERPTREMSVWDGMRLLRGEPGSTVSLLVIRGNAADPHPVEITREIPAAPIVSGRLIGTDVGYLRIPAFAAGIPAAVSARVAELRKAGASRLVVDVRDVADGPLDAGIATARLFVASGTLLHKETKGAGREAVTAGGGAAPIAQPAVVLVNRGTSGAAELFAAALAGNKRAELVGERTHGRAGLQRLVRLNDGSAMLITNAWYLTPGGEPIHQKGLTPAHTVEVPDVEFGAPPPATDPILDKGLELVKDRK
ncbi:MAG TPA: S41 family peptidase [Vicinamibacterales bacterium]|nr:S41 family peptidase [Vicinamibacterales bacterium]